MRGEISNTCKRHTYSLRIQTWRAFLSSFLLQLKSAFLRSLYELSGKNIE